MNDDRYKKIDLDEYAKQMLKEFEANVKNIIAKNASKSRGYMYLDHLINILGWQGGTIHQVLDEVRRLKAFDDSCKAYTNRWTDLASILNLPYYTPCSEVIEEVKRLKQFENDHKIPKDYEKDFFLQVLDVIGLSNCQAILNYERVIEKIKRLQKTSDNLDKAILILQETRKGKLSNIIEVKKNGTKDRT